MKKTFLISLLSLNVSLAMASGEFTVLISKENNSYVHAKTINETTEWLTISSNCEKDKTEDQYYFGVAFEQTETCIDSQERFAIKKKVYPDGKEEELSRVVEKREHVVSVNKTDLTGVHLESTCKDILDNGFSYGDGNYSINQDDTPIVYCDMNRNGGGWMRVLNHDWYLDKSVPNSQFQVTTNRSITATNGVVTSLPDAFWVNDFQSNVDPTIGQWKTISATPIYNWTETMVDFEGLGFRSLDGWHPSSYTGLGDINKQYFDGFSLTYGDIGNTKHIHSFTIGHNNDQEVKDTYLAWLKESDFTYQYQGNYFESNTAKVSASGLLKTLDKSSGKEPIYLRFMADQSYQDESIGFRKYILWVR